ncbi:MAG TPA: type II toxin-antitoxin system RelE/ParE family toxin [Steroidobacteraceae bacterium]|nr:type II toxin-antitoxin system RelE/ParE family toxin [Steroidobacteraceae bacterium]
MAHRLAPGAEIELDEIWFWTAKESGSVEITDRLIDSITERFFMLARHPHVGRPRDDDLRPGLRSFPVGRYVIIYRVESEDVLILDVIAAARDIEPLL